MPREHVCGAWQVWKTYETYVLEQSKSQETGEGQ